MMEQNSKQSDNGRQLVYYSAERTLMAWIRTALSLMALGFVIDRFGLVLRQMLPEVGPILHSQAFSFWAGTFLVLLGTLMAMVAAVRYLLFVRDYRRAVLTRTGHGILLGVFFTVAVAVLGVVITLYLATATLR